VVNVGENRFEYTFVLEKPEEGEHFKNVSVDGRIILKLMLHK